MGRKSDEHYLICGVQGDFTRSLVENPPKTLWTRELKVSFGSVHLSGSGTELYLSLLVSLIPLPSTREASVFAQVPGSALPCRRVYRFVETPAYVTRPWLLINLFHRVQIGETNLEHPL
jgi:hypothetical protein